jgi:zinc protease
MPVTAVSDATFGRVVLTSMIPVLVQFSTEGSGPCMAMAPALDEISKELEGKVRVVKVDVDRNPTVKAEYLVRGLPTQILFKNGKPVARRLGGLVRKEEIEEWVKGALIAALATRGPSTARRAVGFRLSNGMNLVVIPDHRAPIVTHMVWYRVGAADEPEGLSGIARFLEHLTFKSMEKAAAGGGAKAIARLGGEINANSDSDTTVYYQRVAKEHLRTVMEMEADRMVHLDLTDDDVIVEREVLMELRRSTMENRSVECLSEAVAAAHYLGHRHGIPVIGLPDEIATLTLPDIVRFHKLHYAPNNAVVVVSGDVMPEDVKQLSQETYGRLPANPMAGGQSRRQAPAHIATHRVVVENMRSATAEFARRYAVPGYVAARRAEAEVLEVLAWVLSAGRLYRRLVVEDKSASLVTGDYLGGVVDSGAIWINATASGGDLGAL